MGYERTTGELDIAPEVELDLVGMRLAHSCHSCPHDCEYNYEHDKEQYPARSKLLTPV